jgi:phosphopentomutase
MKRATIIVLDGVGIGELPDADKYGDVGSNTLVNLKKAVPEMKLKNMCALGLGNIEGADIFGKVENPCGLYGRLAEHSAGKDTTTGHWEISGVWLDKPFPTYPNGFGDDIIKPFEKAIGKKIIGNKVASGTQIINELGDEHIKTGCPIVYTSADSVFQIAAHEDVIPVATLYEYCKIARQMLNVGRVIARPFIGANGKYTRTERRKDFSLEPTGTTLLDVVKAAGMECACVGKIEDIFAMRGITRSVHTTNNADGIEQTISYLKEDFEGLIFTNLVDTDMLYGHRNDIHGFASALEYFDNKLPEIISAMKKDDIIFITADHGCDPTTASTDHSREYIFLLGCGNLPKMNIGTRATYADIAASIVKYLNIKCDINGKNFL